VNRSAPTASGLVLILLALASGPAVAQSPSPSPAPTFSLATHGEAADDRFRLTIKTDAPRVTAEDAIDLTTTLSYIGAAESEDIVSISPGPVEFRVEQLDGLVDTGPDHAGPWLFVYHRGEVQDIPFSKAGGYDADDPMAPFWRTWFADPELRLPVGRYRIAASLGYTPLADQVLARSLEASVIIEVLLSAAASPSPSVTPATLWTPIDLDLLPWEYACFLPFDPSAIAMPGGIPTDDADLAEMVRAHGPDAHLLMVDDRFALIGEVVDGGRRALDPIYQYRLERWDGDGRWVWSAEGDCRPWATLTGPPAVGGHWRLDPAYPPPTRRSRVLHALVVYSGCPSAVKLRGQPRVVLTDDAVAAVVPVVNRVNSDSCSPGTPTPVTIRLPEPLGDRTLYDASRLPMREVRVP